jgi:hypothetical protein
MWPFDRTTSRRIILRAFQPGDIVFVECEQIPSVAEAERIRATISSVAPQLSVVLLSPGMRVVGREVLVP